MKRLLLLVYICCLLLVPSAQAQANDEYIELKTKYDRFKDETTVEIPATMIWGTQYDGLRILAFYTQKGSTATPPAEIVIAFMLIIKDEKPVRDRNLYFIADGERLVLGEMRDLGIDRPIAGANIFNQQFGDRYPFATLVKLAKARKVEMKVGHIEVEFKPNLMDALRRLANRADPTLMLPIK